jgi:hypothetical protein
MSLYLGTQKDYDSIMEITRTPTGLILVNGTNINMYDFVHWLIANKLGSPSSAKEDIIIRYLTEKELK